LQQLALREAQIGVRVRQMHGLIEEKVVQLREGHVFDEYQQIHREYAALISEDADGLEALKRALFIQWFAIVEPPFCTGICDVDAQACCRVFQELERRASEDILDGELHWMTSWYYQTADFYFRESSQLCINRLANLAAPLAEARRASPNMLQRGQMGIYWSALLRTKAAPSR